MDLTKLKRKYTGDVAESYEDIRVGEKWQNENIIVEDFLSTVAGKEDTLVLDVPVGTGRFFDAYRKLGVTVVGYDVSQDMVLEAQGKINGNDKITVSVKDFFDIEEEVDPDVVVSIRFLRWLDFGDVKRFFAKLSTIGADHVIVGVRYLAGSEGRVKVEHESQHEESSELGRILTASTELVRSEGVVELLRKGWFYVYSKIRREVGKVRGKEMISRHRKPQIYSLISESEYEVVKQENVEKISGREQYDIFLLSKRSG